MKGIPKIKSHHCCPICHKPLMVTYWGLSNLSNPKSEELWRFCCISILDTSFGKYQCYFNTPIIQLPQNYSGKINWDKTKSLTNNIHSVLRDAIDKAIKKNKFIT